MKLIPRKLKYVLPQAVGQMVHVMAVYRDGISIPLQEVPPEDMLAARRRAPGATGRPVIFTLLDDREVHIYPPSDKAGRLSVRFYPAMREA